MELANTGKEFCRNKHDFVKTIEVFLLSNTGTANVFG